MDIAPNRTLGIVGESGCGKSITAKAMLRILPPRGRIVGGSIQLAPRNGKGDPVEITKLSPRSREIRRIRGGDISMIFQEPMSSLSPVHTVGNQIIETVLLHHSVSKREARDRAIEMLRLVGIPIPEQRVDTFPHQLSGGLRQRCMIAMALSCHPRLLIADEPTTALDVTIQAQILDLIEQLQEELGMGVMIITHDLGVIAETADEVAVMYLGRIVEQSTAVNVFDNPKHPYTRGLLRSIPRIGKGNLEKLASIPGSVPNPFSTPPGCPFHPRCEHCIRGVCDADPAPAQRTAAPGHAVACHLYAEKEEGA
ncbi:MAG: ATP-binding cassette domain-containing protein [Nitrospiraceae bacterium]|nr:ATP-binding cassette domain-containing protein [Nitrospiraceae bacterium]